MSPSLIDKGEDLEDLIGALIQQGNKDSKDIIKQKRLQAKMDEFQGSVVDVPLVN